MGAGLKIPVSCAPGESTGLEAVLEFPVSFPSASEKVTVKAGESAHICRYGWI
jgi:hypothetical protein